MRFSLKVKKNTKKNDCTFKYLIPSTLLDPRMYLQGRSFMHSDVNIKD